MKKFKPRMIQQFGCDYCNKRLQSETRMAEHEKKCYYNEERICPNCYDNDTGENAGKYMEEQMVNYQGHCKMVEIDCQACKNAKNALKLRAEFIKSTQL